MDLLFHLPERSPWQFFRVAQLMEKTVVNAIDEFDENLMERKWFRQGLAIFSETPYANRPRREQDVSQLMNDIGDALADFIITLSKWCARRVATDFFNPKPGDALTRAFCIAFADLPKDLERTEAVKECLFQSLFFADDEIFRYRGLPFAVLLEACMGKARPDPNDIPEDVKHEVQSASYGFYECNDGGWTDSRCDEWIEKTVVAIDLARQRIEREKVTSEEGKKLNERVEGIVIDQIGNYLLNAANFLKDCGPNFEDEPDEDYEPLPAMLRDYIKRAPEKLRERVYSVCEKLEREVSEDGEIDFPDLPFLKIVVAPFTEMYFLWRKCAIRSLYPFVDVLRGVEGHFLEQWGNFINDLHKGLAGLGHETDNLEALGAMIGLQQRRFFDGDDAVDLDEYRQSYAAMKEALIEAVTTVRERRANCDVRSAKRRGRESSIAYRPKTAEDAIRMLRERDRREEDEYIERIRMTLEKNWVILTGDNKEVEGKPKGYGVLETIADLLSSDIAELSNGKVSAPMSCGEWQRALPDALAYPYDYVEYYVPADDDDPDSFFVTLSSGKNVLIGRSIVPNALFTSVDKVRDLTLQFLTDALNFAQSIDSKSCDMWVEALGCFKRVDHAFRIPKSRDLLDKMVQLMIDATTKLDVETKFAHRERFRNGDSDLTREVNKTSKSIPCLRRLNEIVVQYYDRKSGKVTGGLLHCDGFRSVIAELKVGGWTNDYNVSREEAEEATDLWMDIRLNLIDYISSLKHDDPLDKIKRGLENGFNHSFLKGFETKDAESRPNESLIKEFGFILREIEQEPFDEMPLTDSQKEEAAEERARGQLGGQIKAATESVVGQLLPPIQKILSIEEERLDDDGKGGQNRQLTDNEEMIIKALAWLKKHKSPRRSSQEAADYVYMLKETFNYWPDGYTHPPKEKKNEDPFVRTITNRRKALPEPV